MTPGVFLDRDGTINEEVGYIRNIADLRLIAGAARAIRRLNEASIPVFLVSNQSGPARGYYPEDWVQTLNDRLCHLLAAEGACLDDVWYCPHLPPDEGGVVPGYAKICKCRKPGTLLLQNAARKHQIDLERSYVVGDKSTDVELGRNAGSRTILLFTGFGRDVMAGRYQWPVTPDCVAGNLEEAIAWILEDVRAAT